MPNENDPSTAFAYEEHLRDYLAKNLSILEASLTLWDGSEVEAVEFPVDGRRIDILAKDKSGVPVVVELKVNRGHERTIGQCLYYRAKIKEIMKVPRVRIFIVAEEISHELKLATQEVQQGTPYKIPIPVSSTDRLGGSDRLPSCPRLFLVQSSENACARRVGDRSSHPDKGLRRVCLVAQ